MHLVELPPTILGIASKGVFEKHVADDIVGSPAYRTHGKTMAADTCPVSEDDILPPGPKISKWHHLNLLYRVRDTHSPRVNSNTIVLVIHRRADNSDITALRDIEAIRIMSAQEITGMIIDGDIRQGQALAVVDAEDMHRRVDDLDPLDGRVGEVDLEELGFLFALFT